MVGIELLSDPQKDTLLWAAAVGYLVVLITAAPMLYRVSKSGVNNYVVLGIVAFTVLIGLSIVNIMILQIQGLSAIILNMAWMILLFQTGVLYGWYRVFDKWLEGFRGRFKKQGGDKNGRE